MTRRRNKCRPNEFVPTPEKRRRTGKPGPSRTAVGLGTRERAAHEPPISRQMLAEVPVTGLSLIGCDVRCPKVVRRKSCSAPQPAPSSLTSTSLARSSSM